MYNNGSKVNEGRNYTLNSSVGEVYILNQSGGVVGAQSEWVTAAINASFEYTTYFDTAVSNVSRAGNQGAVKFAGWFGTLGLIAGVIIVLGIIYNMLVPIIRRKE